MDGHEVVVTIDVEWAHPAVLADVVALLDERGLRATLFCTHEGIAAPGHELALHPSFRGVDRPDGYRSTVEAIAALYPDAVGVRTHSLFHDSDLLALYRDAGLEYDSSYFLPLEAGLGPVWKGRGILELPLYYMDHWDLGERATGFELGALRLGTPGLKILAFHPNLVYLNAATEEQYAESKASYHDPDSLLRRRHRGRGARTLFVELLDWLAESPAPPVLAEVNERWRQENRAA